MSRGAQAGGRREQLATPLSLDLGFGREGSRVSVLMGQAKICARGLNVSGRMGKVGPFFSDRRIDAIPIFSDR